MWGVDSAATYTAAPLLGLSDGLAWCYPFLMLEDPSVAHRLHLGFEKSRQARLFHEGKAWDSLWILYLWEPVRCHRCHLGLH